MEKEAGNEAPKLALVAIVKNESHCVTRMIASVAKYVSCIVINDTGSTDDTQERIQMVCEGLGVPLIMISSEFNGFANARNRALEMVPSDIDYVLQLDADEVLHSNGFNEDLWADAHVVYVTNGEKELVQVLRIFKPHFRYSGEIHEFISGVFTTGVIHPDKTYIEHIHDGARACRENNDDLDILKKLHSHSDDPRWLFYVGETYYAKGKFDVAKNFFIQRSAIQSMNGFDEERYLSMLRTCMCFLAIGDNFMALGWALESLRFSKRVEPAFIAMSIFNQMKIPYMACHVAQQVDFDSMGIIVMPSIRRWGFDYEYLQAASHLRSPQTAVRLAKKILYEKQGIAVPESVKKFAKRFV